MEKNSTIYRHIKKSTKKSVIDDLSKRLLELEVFNMDRQKKLPD